MNDLQNGLLGSWVVVLSDGWVVGLLGHIDWVVGGRVVFFVFVVLSVFPVFVGLVAFLLCC